MEIKIPKRFYDDCVEAETFVPLIVRHTKAHYVIDIQQADPDEPAGSAAATMADFISRAEYYADPLGFTPEVRPITQSAKATLAAMDKAVRA